jgi:hypothetical protein
MMGMRRSRLLKHDAAHGLTVRPPNRDRLTMRAKPLKSLHLIVSLSKGEACISAFLSIPLVAEAVDPISNIHRFPHAAQCQVAFQLLLTQP